MKNFILQATFEDCYQELLLAIQEHVTKYGDFVSPYNSCIQSLLFQFEDDKLHVKTPQSKLEKYRNELLLLTLEDILQIPLFFNPNEGRSVDNIKQYIDVELYQKYITKENAVAAKLHFVFYISLTNKTVIHDIERLLSQLPENLPIFIDFVTFPNDVSRHYREEQYSEEDAKTMSESLSYIIALKDKDSIMGNNRVKIKNIYFLQNLDESNQALQLDHTKLSSILGNLTLSLIEGYDYISYEAEDPITTFSVNTFEIDKYSAINNWALTIFKNLCDKIVGNAEEQKTTDKEKVNRIFSEIIEEERNGLEDINSLPDKDVEIFLKKWKDNFKDKILNKIINANLTNAEKNLLLSYFQNLTERNLHQLEDFDFEKLDLFDSLYIPYIKQTSDKEDSYLQLKELILQIRKLKEEIKKREKNISETHKLIDENYRRDGTWTDEGYRIGNDVFKIHKTDLIGSDDSTGELLSEYQPNLSQSLPLNADLKSYFPPIKNQGKQGACAAFSLTSVFEYFFSNETQKSDDMSEAFVYYNARDISGQTSIDDGANLHDVIRGMIDKGVCIEELCKYNPEVFDKKPSLEAYEDAENRKVASAKSVPIDVDIIKSAINEGYPVVGCFKIFKSLQNNTSGFVPMPTDEERNNDDGFHAMVICGYNDNYGHFIVRNSWGTSFGDKGYCYLPYSYVRDTDLTRYAVAITGINAKDFIKHKPIDDKFDFGSKDKNIQYAIFMNMLKEDEHRLETDRHQVKLLINKLRKLIEEIKSKDDVSDLQLSVDKKIKQIESDNLQLKQETHQVSIRDNRVIHVVHICILFLSLLTIGSGLYYEKRYFWIIATITSVIDLISWIVCTILSKRKSKKNIEQKIERNEQEKRNLLNSIDKKIKFRDRVILILNAIGDIDDDSRSNIKHLDSIISTLNNCYNKIAEYLNNNYQDNQVICPDWFKNISKNLPAYDLLKELLTNPEGKDIRKGLKTIQKKILRHLNDNFNKSIDDLHEDKSLWQNFIDKVAQSKVYAQINTSVYETKLCNEPNNKQRSFFLSDLDKTVDINDINKTDIPSQSRNRFIFIKLKKVSIDELIIFEKYKKEG